MSIFASQNPLLKIQDNQWVKLVEMLTENVLALNSKILTKIKMR